MFPNVPVITYPPGGTGTGSTDDMFSTLVNTPVSVTTTATAQVGKLHYITGTTVDYTLAFPPVSGNDNKAMGFIFGPTLTQLSRFVTVDGDGSETIGGTTSRVLWAGEAFITICDEANNNWAVLAYKANPMICQIQAFGTQSINPGVEVQVNLTSIHIDNTGRMADTANNQIVPKRKGTYRLGWGGNYWPMTNCTDSPLNYFSPGVNGTGLYFVSDGLPGPNSYFSVARDTIIVVSLVSNTYTLLTGQYTAHTQILNGAGGTYLSLAEIPIW